MSDKPKRFWRLHLSTAVLLMFTAGGLLWGNFNERQFSYTDGHSELEWMTTGWPFEVQRHRLSYGTSVWVPSNAIKELDRSWVEFSWNMLVANVGVGVLILSGVAVISESFQRRDKQDRPLSLEQAKACILAETNNGGNDTRSSDVIVFAFENAARADPAAAVEMCREFYDMFRVSGELPKRKLFSPELVDALERAHSFANGEEAAVVIWMLNCLRGDANR